MQVVYVDVLFIINFCMDFLALYLSGLFLHIKQKPFYLFCASVVGGIYAVFSIIFSGYKIFDYIIGIAVSLLLCYITYSKEISRHKFFRLCIIFYFISILLGGAITAFYNLLNSFFNSYEFVHIGSRNKLFVFMLAVMFCSALIIAFLRFFSGSMTESSCKITLRINNKTKSIYALIDSGNFLKEPISCKDVIIVSFKSVKPFLSEQMIKAISNGTDGIKYLPIEEAKKVRIIPVKSITGNKILLGYLPEKIEIETIKNGRPNVFSADAIIGFDIEKENFSGYDAIIPQTLII